MDWALWEAPGVVLVVGWLGGRDGPLDRGGWVGGMGNGMEVVAWEGWAMAWRCLSWSDGQWAVVGCGGRDGNGGGRDRQ